MAYPDEEFLHDRIEIENKIELKRPAIDVQRKGSLFT